MKKLYTNRITVAVAAGFTCLVIASSFMYKDPTCPMDYTMAPKPLAPNLGRTRNCTSCHGDFTLNTLGSVVVTGLPTTSYVPGQAYNFTVKINHNNADRTVWGFAVKAVNTTDNYVVGNMTTTNPNATVKGTVGAQTQELSHEAAATSAAASSYTYLNLTWTAPASPVAKENNIRFYITGVACDGDGSEAGDYVYTTTVNAVLGSLPLQLVSFNAKRLPDNTVQLRWETAQENNSAFFDVEYSQNSLSWYKLSSITANGNSSMAQQYSYSDKAAAKLRTGMYYRLKMVDKDGSFKYSTIQHVMPGAANLDIASITAQPIKAHAASVFTISSEVSKIISIHVTDQSGRVLYNSSQSIAAGSQQLSIPAGSFNSARGFVYITFAAEGYKKTFKQMVE